MLSLKLIKDGTVMFAFVMPEVFQQEFVKISPFVLVL